MKDDLRRTVTLRGPARRIVSLSPATTENLFAVGAGPHVVGVTTACDFPAAAASLPRIGDFTRPSYERILALKPDLLVLDSATVRAAEAEALAARVRIPVFVQQTRRIADLPRHLEELAQLCGTTTSTTALRQALRPMAPRGARPRVLIEISSSPLYAVGPGSFVDDLIWSAGGRNLLTSGGPFPQLSRERLAKTPPDLYVIATNPGGAPTAPAVPAAGVLRVPADFLLRPTPRMAEGYRRLRDALRV